MSSFLLIAWMSLFPVFGGSGTPLPKPTGPELEVHQAHRPVAARDRAQDAERHGMVAADAHRQSALGHDLADLRLDGR